MDFSTCYSALQAYNETVYKSMLYTSTTNYRGQCLGDSAGPVACTLEGTTYLAGVVSWGAGGCAMGIPVVNSYVSYFTDNINSAISNCVTFL